jgi:hypothetical protein
MSYEVAKFDSANATPPGTMKFQGLEVAAWIVGENAFRDQANE